jgi:SAM-dependent methyltransferase
MSAQAWRDYRGSFDDAEAYDRFIGRYSALFAPQLAELAGVETGQRVLDVGCGPGAVASEVARRIGAECVSALDPSEAFISAVKARNPGVTTSVGRGEALPFPDGTFDRVLAQLCVQFMDDPAAGLAEMVRVARPRGVIAVCDWNRSRNPLDPFWDGARELDPASKPRRGDRPFEHRAVAFDRLGLEEVETIMIGASVRYETFEDWWEPMTTGVGPSATYAKSLDTVRRERLRDHLREQMPAAPFVLAAEGRITRGVVPGRGG